MIYILNHFSETFWIFCEMFSRILNTFHTQFFYYIFASGLNFGIIFCLLIVYCNTLLIMINNSTNNYLGLGKMLYYIKFTEKLCDAFRLLFLSLFLFFSMNNFENIQKFCILLSVFQTSRFVSFFFSMLSNPIHNNQLGNFF